MEKQNNTQSPVARRREIPLISHKHRRYWKRLLPSCLLPWTANYKACAQCCHLCGRHGNCRETGVQRVADGEGDGAVLLPLWGATLFLATYWWANISPPGNRPPRLAEQPFLLITYYVTKFIWRQKLCCECGVITWVSQSCSTIKLGKQRGRAIKLCPHYAFNMDWGLIKSGGLEIQARGWISSCKARS